MQDWDCENTADAALTEFSLVEKNAPTSSLFLQSVGRHGVHPPETTKRHAQTQGCLDCECSGGGGGADLVLMTCVYPHDIEAHASNQGAKSPGSKTPGGGGVVVWCGVV